VRFAKRQVLLWIPVLASMAGCASAPRAGAAGQAPARGPGPTVVVLTPRDTVPVRSLDVFTASAGTLGMDDARSAALLGLRGDLAESLRNAGLSVREVDPPPWEGGRPTAEQLAAWGRAEGAEQILDTELIAYGEIRRSWLWALGAQALVAGIGHGVAAAAATGDSSLGWWVGAGEFALETTVWVGGALVGSRRIDPVLVRARWIDVRTGRLLGQWRREGTRPVGQWLRRSGEARSERLRAVSRKVFGKLAGRIARRSAGSSQIGR